MNVRIAATDSAEVALEMTVIRHVEAHNGNIETDVCFSEPAANEVIFPFQYLLDTVQRFKD